MISKPEERVDLYAQTLEACVRAALVIIVLSFFLYVSGLIEPMIPVDRISMYWSQDPQVLLKASGYSGGWDWITHLPKPDMLSFFGISILLVATPLALIIRLPLMLKRRDFLYALLASVEVGILSSAAFGLLA